MDKIKQRIKTILDDLNYYLYDVEYVTENNEKILRVMIENDTHITLDDCVVVSEHLNQAFDVEDVFEEPYNLEVTSAGAEHELHTVEQIKRAIGKHVFIATFDQQVTGQLVSYKDNVFTIQVNQKSKTKINEMDVQQIRLAIVL